MTAAELIAHAEARGVHLKAERRALFARPATALPPGLRNELAAHRKELIKHLCAQEGRPRSYSVLVTTPHLDEPIWIASDERALVTNDVVTSGHIAILAYEIVLLGPPSHIRELILAKRVFGPRARAISADQRHTGGRRE